MHSRVAFSLKSFRAPLSRSLSSQQPQALIELTENFLYPGETRNYLREANSAFPSNLKLPLRTFTMPDSGGLKNVATQTFFYGGGHEERESLLSSHNATSWASEFGEKTDKCISQQRSTLWVEAPLVKSFGALGMACTSIGQANSTTIYEFRTYELKLGYPVVPRFLELYTAGLPSKLSAPGSDPSTSLVTVINTEVGSLNNVIELWRHGGGTSAMEMSRKAARGAAEWRSAISQIAELSVRFTSVIHRPTQSSPWQ